MCYHSLELLKIVISNKVGVFRDTIQLYPYKCIDFFIKKNILALVNFCETLKNGKMLDFELMSPTEKVVRLVSLAALLTLAICAVKFFKVWYIAALSVFFTQEVLILLGILCWACLGYIGIGWVKKRLFPF